MAVTATLTKPTRDQIYETTAENVVYSCSATLPNNSNTTYQKIEYNTLTYKWTFSDGGSSTSQSGTHTFSGLAQGAPNDIFGQVKVYCTQQIYTRYDVYSDVPTGEVDENGNPIYEKKWVGYSSWTLISTNDEYSVGSASTDTYTIYTHPGESTIFSNLAYNQIIEYNLTSAMVAEWCIHCGKWLSWYNQADNYSSADGCKVDSKSWILASWYNQCVATALASSPTVTGGSNGTIIQAGYFQALDELVSRRE